MRFSMHILATVLVSPILDCGASSASAAEASAGEVIEVSGVQGGLVVHVGCGDGTLTVGLRANDRYLVHGLDTRADHVAAAREHARSLDAYGPVSIDRFDGAHLPYVDNSVNLIVADELGGVTRAEVMRVLTPNGVLCVRQGDEWTKTVKPRPEAIDDWTHYLYDATNNAVSKDAAIGPPRHIQWVSSPTWTRHHDRMSSFSAMVSAGGRVFYVVDEGPRASVVLPSEWRLVARDAFNGKLLWKRDIPTWHPQLWPLKNGPAQLPRRLVAVGDRVFITLGQDAPVSALEASTGQTLWTCKASRGTEEIVHADGVLYLVVNKRPDKRGWGRGDYPSMQALIREAQRKPWERAPSTLLAVSAETGEVVWQRDYIIAPLTLAVGSGRIFVHNGRQVICVDRKTHKELWRSPELPSPKAIFSFFAPTLVVYGDVVLFAGAEKMKRHRGGRDTMHALSVETGQVLWTAPHPPSGYDSPEDVLVADGLVWTADITNVRDQGVFVGRDPQTGEVKRQYPPDAGNRMPHHRCHRAKATERFILASRTGIECVDVTSGEWTRDYWVRGACLYGIMPANGLTYAPPHSCACYIVAKLNGMNALATPAARRPLPEPASDEARLERGPAYGEVTAAGASHDGDWPTYRCDEARSGMARTTVPAKLRPAWTTKLGGKLSSPVVAGTLVFVASIDAHTVYALDAETGRQRWSTVAGGRVDSPPTIHRGYCVFGSADGWVTCLRAADGELVWRFRAAPVDRRIVSYDRLESVWPVHGSVLIRQDGSRDVVTCVAGRSMFLDGGLRLLRLDLETGETLSEWVLDDRTPDTGERLQAKAKWPNLPVALPDVLSCDGKRIYMRSQPFDLSGKRTEVLTPRDYTDQQGATAHLFCPTGFLDDTWWHRTYWIYGKNPISAAGGWYLAGYRAPTGRILAFDEDRVYGFGRASRKLLGTPVVHHLFSCGKAPEFKKVNPKEKPRRRGSYGLVFLTEPEYAWSKPVPLHARALVLAPAGGEGGASGKRLFIAGPPDVVDQAEAIVKLSDAETRQKLADQSGAFRGEKGGLLWSVSAGDGERLAEYKLDSIPVFDGMAAARGRLFLSMVDGRLMCMAGR